jgi:hypothetical protein
MRIVSLLVSLAAGSLGAQQIPTIRLLNAPDAKTKPVLRNPVSVRQLPNGSLLVNDTERRQVLLLDNALAETAIVADSASGAANAYGARGGGLIPYLADSSLFIDPTGLSLLVISPEGKVARTGSIPRSQDAMSMTTAAGGWPGLDAKGRLVYRGPMMPQRASNGGMTMGQSPDSMEITRLNLATRKVDTAAWVKIAKVKINVMQTEKGMSVGAEINPVQTVDDWAVLSTGTIAVVRGLDYHVDFINADGKTMVAPKIPFEWQSLGDDDKVALLDSLKRVMSVQMGGGEAGGAMNHGGGGAATPVGGHQLNSVKFVAASELPDYMPPFDQGAARADVDGNLWVRTSARRAGAIGGQIYDVIDGTGKLIDRLQLPAGRQVVGFGKGGVVYLKARDATGAWIERASRR